MSWAFSMALETGNLTPHPSCEMCNDHLDRALVVPVMGVTGVAFFESPG